MAKIEKVSKTITGLELKWEVLLVYAISVLGFIFSFLKNEKVSKETRFHYNQAGATFIIYVGIAIIDSILTALSIPLGILTLGVFSVILWIIVAVLWLLEVAVIVFAVITVVKAFHNEKFEIPIVNNLAKMIWKE
jgi:uncharacterized membrane protein